uniref:Uncharacterized protein n=1 Tax=Nothobranchius furzeri TaxID=105023 RepID=A0A8C6LMG2_NOTFU
MAESPKRKGVFEVYEKKRKASEVRNKTRVFLGDFFQRWCSLKETVGLSTDAAVACFLLDR